MPLCPIRSGSILISCFACVNTIKAVKYKRQQAIDARMPRVVPIKQPCEGFPTFARLQGSLNPVHIMRTALAHARRGDFDKFGIFLQFLDIVRPAVT
jgi:hypothetical protein